jgi:hypothetical protein
MHLQGNTQGSQTLLKSWDMIDLALSSLAVVVMMR